MARVRAARDAPDDDVPTVVARKVAMLIHAPLRPAMGASINSLPSSKSSMMFSGGATRELLRSAQRHLGTTGVYIDGLHGRAAARQRDEPYDEQPRRNRDVLHVQPRLLGSPSQASLTFAALANQAIGPTADAGSHSA